MRFTRLSKCRRLQHKAEIKIQFEYDLLSEHSFILIQVKVNNMIILTALCIPNCNSEYFIFLLIHKKKQTIQRLLLHNKKRDSRLCYLFQYDPYGIRTRVTAVKGRCLNHLTNGPITGREEGIRTLAPRSRSTPLAGEPLEPLGYFSVWLRRQDSNLRPIG